MYFQWIKNSLWVLFVPSCASFGSAAFLHPLCQSRTRLFFIRFIAFYQEPNSSCALMGRCSSVFFGEKIPRLPDLWPVASSKNSTTGNFRKARSNSCFWNRAVPRRRDRLPAQYVKSKTWRSCVMVGTWGRGDVSVGYKTASHRKQHARRRVAWGCMCSECDPKTGAQVLWVWRPA